MEKDLQLRRLKKSENSTHLDYFVGSFGSNKRKHWRLRIELKQMRWHPICMLIKWCLSLKSLSTAFCHALRSSDLLVLPSSTCDAQRVYYMYNLWKKDYTLLLKLVASTRKLRILIIMPNPLLCINFTADFQYLCRRSITLCWQPQDQRDGVVCMDLIYVCSMQRA